MALGALTLSTTQGVQGRPFGAAIVGLTTGKVEVLGDGSPGFSTVNGRVSSNGLPYPISTVVLREYEPGVGQGYRDSRIDITAATREQLVAQALASLSPGRTLVNFRVAGDRQADGTINYSLRVQDDLGATGSLSIGGPPLPTLALSGPLSFTVGAAAGTLVANISNVPAGATPTVAPNDGRLAIAGDAVAGWKVVVGLSASSVGTINITVNAAGALPATGTVTVASGQPVTSAGITAVNADGWSAAYPGANTKTFDPEGSPEYLVLDRQGFDGTGAPNVTRTALLLTRTTRKPYPDQTQLDTTKVALSDYVYSTDTIVGGSASNGSTKASPKPVANWSTPNVRTVVGNTIALEVVAAHRDARNAEAVACVEFIVSGNIAGVPSTVSQKVSVSSVSTACPRDRTALTVYAASVNVSTFDDNQTLTVNAKVYPFFGGAASVKNTADSAVTRDFSPRTFYRSTSLASAPPVAYVDPVNGNDSTGVASTNPATAAASPCLTVAGAMKRAKTLIGNNDGLRIRLKAGTHAGFGTSPISTEVSQTVAEMIVEGDPAVNDPTTIIMNMGAASFRPRVLWQRFRNFTLNRTGATQFSAETGGSSVIMENITGDMGGYSSVLWGSSSGSTYWIGASLTNVGGALFNAGTTENRMIRGVTIVSGTATFDKWLLLTSYANGGAAFNSVTGAEDNSIVVGNYFPQMTITFLNIAGSANVLGGWFWANNVFEFTGTSSATAVRASADSGTGSTRGGIIWHNTGAGLEQYGRWNLFYDETTGTARDHDLFSYRGNLVPQLNTKGDVFMQDATRLGNFAFVYGVGCFGNVAQYIDAGGGNSYFGQVYPGLRSASGTPTSSIDPLFVNPQATTTGPVAGSGFGDYALQDDSPAASRLSPLLRPMRFDARGVARGPFTAAGAFVPLSGDVEVPIDTGGGSGGGAYVPAGADAGDVNAAPLTGASPLTLTIQGVKIDLENVASSGQYIDGSWWVVPNHADGVGLKAVSIASTETTDLFLGGCMLDPGRPERPNIKKHGFDWRTVGNKTNPNAAKVGSGPGNTYDPSYSLLLPRRVKPYANGPVTIWVYRGLDNGNFNGGGGASGCANMVQLTVCATAPGATAIKPPGLYVAGGKPQKTRSDINYAALPSLTLPGGAVQPNWDSDFGFHKYPTWRWGNRNEAAAILPRRTQEMYPADQSVLTNMTALGCCYNIAKRNELIERMVRDGMEVQAGTAFAPNNNAYFAGGGFGPAGRLPRFIAGIVLGDASYLALPPKVYIGSDSNSALIDFFAEDCSTYWSVRKTGDTANPGSGTYQALFGTPGAPYPGDYPASHTDRDINKLRDSYRLAQFTWTVESVGANFFTVTAASHNAAKVYQPHNNTNQGYHRACRIMTGTNAGKWVFLSQNVNGVDVGWEAATRKVTIETSATWAQPVAMPSVGDVVEYRPAAVYDEIVMGALTGTALAVVTMGKVAEYCVSEDIRAMFMRAKQFIDDTGLDTDKAKMSPPFQRSGNAVSRTWGPGEAGSGLPAGAPLGKWLALIYGQQSANWPAFTGPL